jgi:hypothetical protein
MLYLDIIHCLLFENRRIVVPKFTEFRRLILSVCTGKTVTSLWDPLNEARCHINIYLLVYFVKIYMDC